MLLKIKAVIEKNQLLLANQSVIVGLSGGADSICLTYILKQLGYNPIAVHIEHGIRGKEALSDAEFVKNFCKENNIECYIEHIDIPKIAKEKRISLETCGRIERYNIFDKYSQKFNCPIAVAHNKNDQAETVLLHLARGSGLSGLCGIYLKSQNIIRPLLFSTRKEIETYLSENNLRFVTDSTNFSDDYSRNSVRHNIIPKLEEINSCAIDAVFSCSEKLKEYKSFIDNIAESEFKKALVSFDGNSVIYNITNVDKIISEEIIFKAIQLLNGNIVDIESSHINGVYSLYKTQSGKEVHLPLNIRAKKIYNQIHIYYEKEKENYFYDFIPCKRFDCNGEIISSRFAEKIKKAKNSEFVDFDKLPEKLTLRTRNEGDFIIPLGMNNKVLLKKYFIDKKIPLNIRNNIPLLCYENEVFVILGKTVSDKVKITGDTKKILNLYKE